MQNLLETTLNTRDLGGNIDITQLSSKYHVRKLREEDIEIIYELFMGNPMFFEYCPPLATPESIGDDMKALPPGMTYEDKYYIGFFDGDKLITVIDLIMHYPNQETAFIGFFMMNVQYQGKGVGSAIVEEMADCLNKNGYVFTRLGYVKGNPQSRAFWVKNHFEETGVESHTEDYTMVVMQRKNKR